MVNIIPINYKELNKMTQTSVFDIDSRQYSVTLRKSTISDNCYITIKVDNTILCENKVCTCDEILTENIVDASIYPEWFYFEYLSDDTEKNFDYNELGKTLFLLFWNGDISDFI